MDPGERQGVLAAEQRRLVRGHRRDVGERQEKLSDAEGDQQVGDGTATMPPHPADGQALDPEPDQRPDRHHHGEGDPPAPPAVEDERGEDDGGKRSELSVGEVHEAARLVDEHDTDREHARS